jgi:hypothetical protein
MANELGKGAAIVTVGGLANIGLEYLSQKVSKQEIAVGKVDLWMPDAVGVLAAIAEIMVGVVSNKPNVVLFGAGGLASATGMVVSKTLTAYNPLNAGVPLNASVQPRTIVADTRPIGSGSQHPAQIPSNSQLEDNIFIV